MTIRQETRRKIPDYFNGCSTLSLDWSRSRGWSVGFWCEQLHRWDWAYLKTDRVGKKLEAEAKAAAVRLMRASLERCEAAIESMSVKANRLSIAATRFESGEIDGSAL